MCLRCNPLPLSPQATTSSSHSGCMPLRQSKYSGLLGDFKWWPLTAFCPRSTNSVIKLDQMKQVMNGAFVSVGVLDLCERPGFIQESRLKATLAVSPSRCRVPSGVSGVCWIIEPKNCVEESLSTCLLQSCSLSSCKAELPFKSGQFRTSS